MANKISQTIEKDLYILENEDNPHGSQVIKIHPSTTIDQVSDPTDVTNPTLRELLEALHQEIITGGLGNIVFPVTSVNGEQGDVVIDIDSLGLENIDLTKDIDKPLSNPQRAAVMEILNNYHFEVDLSALEDHLQDTNNPHGVTFEQINHDNAVDELIATYLTRHNSSTSEDTHRDIRNTLVSLRSTVEENTNRLITRLDQLLSALSDHVDDTAAHSLLFDTKEDVDNKSLMIDSYATHHKYPSERAVVEYVKAQLDEYATSLDIPTDWITDIQVVDSRSDLPAASQRFNRRAYFILHGNNFYNEIAVCRESGGSYSWEYNSLESYTTFDPTFFITNNNGLSLNEHAITESVIRDDSVRDLFTDLAEAIVPGVMDNYYTKDEIDQHHYVESVTILKGTQDGSIRYYINGDQSTMSYDVFVAGLKKLAFLDKLTEGFLEDNSVDANALMNRSVERRHMGDRAVGAPSMYAPYMTLFANVNDSEGDRVDNITIEEMAELFAPKFKEIFEESTLYQDFETAARKFAREEIHKYHGWPYPEAEANFVFDDGRLKFIMDNEDVQIDLSINAAKELIATYDENETIATLLDNTSFQIINDDLYMTTA